MEEDKTRILIVDDEEGIREQLRWSLKGDYDVQMADSVETGIAMVKEINPELVILDLTLSENGADDEGFTVFREIRAFDTGIKIIIVTGNEQKELAFRAVQMGAYDFYKKPIELDELRIIVDRAVQLRKIEQELDRLSEKVRERRFNDEMIGECNEMQQIYNIVERTSPTNATVLLNSESGTGKELIARAVHSHSLRKDMPFVVINCGAIPENLLESELFGHEKGAFTGAHQRKKGKFELADSGTLFLDEIGEMAVSLQVKLLRFLQDHQIERVGGQQPIELDVRIIAATNRNLESDIINGSFREDLFYRLSVITINVPPLRNRGKDKELLSEYFLKKYRAEYNLDVKGFSEDARKLIDLYDWPGNVRELENKVKRSVIMTKGQWIGSEDLNITSDKNSETSGVLKDAVEAFEKRCIEQALLRNGANISRTATDLGVNRTTFYYLLRKYEIRRDSYIDSR